jgi:hypothetical protein
MVFSPSECFNAGIKSVVRSQAVNQNVQPRLYGECAYRATVAAEDLLSEPDLQHFIEQPVANCWIGPGRHLMAYPIQHKTKYNLVMIHPGLAVQDRWNEPGDLKEMVDNFASWDPLLVRVLNKVQECLKWNLADLPLLDTWRSKSGKVVLIGDASHATLPFVFSPCDFADGSWLKALLWQWKMELSLPNVFLALPHHNQFLCIFKRLNPFVRNGRISYKPDQLRMRIFGIWKTGLANVLGMPL